MRCGDNHRHDLPDYYFSRRYNLAQVTFSLCVSECVLKVQKFSEVADSFTAKFDPIPPSPPVRSLPSSVIEVEENRRKNRKGDSYREKLHPPAREVEGDREKQGSGR